MTETTPRPDDDDDSHLWQEEIADCRPLQQKKHLPSARYHAAPHRATGLTAIVASTTYHCPQFALAAETELYFFNAAISTRHAQQLIDQAKPQRSIDLHGMSTRQAHTLLDETIARALSQQQFCLHLIHGKGKQSNSLSIMKAWLNCYLQSHPHCRGFASCPPKHGGTGAVFIWLSQTTLR